MHWMEGREVSVRAGSQGWESGLGVWEQLHTDYKSPGGSSGRQVPSGEHSLFESFIFHMATEQDRTP